MKLGVILGTTRTPCNTAGIEAYVSTVLAAEFPHIEVERINLATSPGHPLSLDIPMVPALLTIDVVPDAYVDEKTKAWSKTVLSWDGILVITPQYNASVPAPLKNAFDQLYSELNNMPIGLISVGYGGGPELQATFKRMMAVLKAKVCEKGVMVPLGQEVYYEKAYAKGDEEWITKHKDAVVALVKELEENAKEFSAIKADRGQKTVAPPA